MPDTILVLSANSKVGAEALRLLQEAGANVRAGVRNPSKSMLAQAVETDLDRPETLAEAMKGVDKVLLSTAADANQVKQHNAAIQAAREAGVRHMVRISVTGAGSDAPTALQRMNAESERALEASGMAYTHLRPESFMQNLLGMAALIARGQLFGCSGEGQFAVVDLRDIAAVAVAALIQPGHENKSYEITGPESLSLGDQAAILGRVLGWAVHYIDVPGVAIQGGMMQAGLPEWLAADLAYLHSEVVAQGKAIPVSPHVERVLGRGATPFERFVRDHAAVFVAATAAGAS